MESKVNALVDKKLAKAMKRVAQQDYKVLNFASLSVGFNYDSGAGYVNHATSIVPGTSISARLGNEIRLKRLRWNYTFLAGDNYNVCRFLIVRGKSVGAVPTSNSTMAANILSGFTGNAQVHAPVDKTMWDTLHEEYFEVHYAPVDGSTSATTQIPHTTRGEVDLGNVLLRYSQQSSTVITGKQVVLLFVSDSIVAPNPTVTGYSAIEFTEA